MDVMWILIISVALWIITAIVIWRVDLKANIKFFIGFVLIFSGSMLGLYVGGYLCLYGGIVQIIHGIKENFEWSTIAFGVLRVVCTAPAAVITTALVAKIGAKMFP